MDLRCDLFAQEFKEVVQGDRALQGVKRDSFGSETGLGRLSCGRVGSPSINLMREINCGIWRLKMSATLSGRESMFERERIYAYRIYNIRKDTSEKVDLAVPGTI